VRLVRLIVVIRRFSAIFGVSMGMQKTSRRHLLLVLHSYSALNPALIEIENGLEVNQAAGEGNIYHGFPSCETSFGCRPALHPFSTPSILSPYVRQVPGTSN